LGDFEYETDIVGMGLRKDIRNAAFVVVISPLEKRMR